MSAEDQSEFDRDDKYPPYNSRYFRSHPGSVRWDNEKNPPPDISGGRAS